MRAVFLILCLVCSGCATGQLSWTSEKTAQVTTRTYPYKYENVFAVIVKSLKAKGTPIESIDKENGIINTGYKSMGGVIWDTGKMKLNIALTKISDTQTRVSLYLHLEGYSSTFGIATTDDLVSEKHYQDMFAAMEKTFSEHESELKI